MVIIAYVWQGGDWMNKGLEFKLKVKGMDAITKKLEEMEEHIKKAISCADEIAKMEIECEVIC